MELLLEAGAKVTRGAVLFDVQDGTERCLKLLIQGGADPSVLLLNAVRTSGVQRHKKVKLLINAGADVNFIDEFYNHSTTLSTAVGSANVKCVKLLLDAGADVNMKDVDGNTALHYSHCLYKDEINRKVRSIKVLLRAGIKVNVINKPRNQQRVKVEFLVTWRKLRRKV